MCFLKFNEKGGRVVQADSLLTSELNIDSNFPLTKFVLLSGKKIL